jgi:small multidrug resistance pump
MHWFYLALAILCEVVGTTCIKLSDGFKNTSPSVMIFIFYGIAFFFLSLAVKKIDISVSYAIWSGVGTALIAMIGVFLFKESMTTIKLISITLIIAGVVGLNLGKGGH